MCYLCIYNKSFQKTFSIEVKKQAFYIHSYYFSKSLNEMKIYTNNGDYFSFSSNQSNKDYFNKILWAQSFTLLKEDLNYDINGFFFHFLERSVPNIIIF